MQSFDFTYHNPVKVIFGENKIKSLGQEIAKFGIKKVLIIAGSGSIKSNGVYDQVVSSLNQVKIDFVEFWGVRPNPELDHANQAIDFARKHNVEAIVAVGGGSVIDESKSIAVGFYIDNLWDAFEKKVLINQALPLFTVLTLSATASEMNMFAVLQNDKEKKKWAIGSNLIYPKVTIIDPSIQTSLPWNQTVNGGVDAISHLMEFYFLGTHQEINISIIEAIMKTIIKAVDDLQVDQSNLSARSNLAWAATMALNGIPSTAIQGEWSVHGIEHGISAFAPRIAHAEGLSVVFPAWVEYTHESNPNQYVRWAKNIWGKDSLQDAIKAFKRKLTQWQSPVSMRDLGIDESDFSEIAALSTLRGPLGNLKKLSRKDVENILRIAY